MFLLPDLQNLAQFV